MKNNIKQLLKQTLVIALSIMMLLSGIFTSISTAQATDLYSQLATNKALCSPILSGDRFDANQWNKWEYIVWGIFLSNFCQPLIDDYSSAFNTGLGGSEGAGFKALAFSTGNDSENNNVIKDFCAYAIQQQKASSKTIYVTYNKIVDDEVVIKSDINTDGTEYRNANFKDLFISYQDKNNKVTDNGTQINDLENAYANIVITDAYISEQSDSMSGYTVTTQIGSDNTVKADAVYSDLCTYTAYVPTFWIRNSNSGKYIKILDYTDPWDVQIVSSIFGKVANTKYSDSFLDTFNNNYENSVEIKLDCFGNITTNDHKVILPASTNQHLTTERKINLLNSLILNNNTSVTSTTKLIEGTSQYEENKFDLGMGWNDRMFGDVPALSGGNSKLKNGQTFIYFDLTTAMVDNIGKMSYGGILMDFFREADINNKGLKYNLRIETVNKLGDSWNSGIIAASSKSFNDNSILINTQLAASLISTHINLERQPEYLTELTLPNGNIEKMFGEPVAITVGTDVTDDKSSQSSILRRFYNFLYTSCKNGVKTSSGELSATTLQNIFKTTNSISGLATTLTDKNMIEYYRLSTGDEAKDFKLSKWFGDDFSKKTSRVIILYPTSDNMQAVADILGINDGTEFSVYAPYIYMTYLDWYGVLDGTPGILNGEIATSDLDEGIFDESPGEDPEAISPDVNSDPKKKEALLKDYGYLMLHPEEGRSYRSQIQKSAIADMILNWYESMTFGDTSGGFSANNYNNTGDGSSGFLAIRSYNENFLTRAFLANYVDICVWLVMILFVAMIVIGIVKGRKISWYFVTSFVIISSLLLAPSSGELVPYFSSNIVQEIFSDNMTHWSISEAISNASLEKDMAKNTMANLSEEEASQVVYLVKQLNVINLDRSLMVKKDISTKTIQELNGSYYSIQSIASARWLLPVIMRQFSQEDAGADYLYIPVGDLLDDFSNLYWMYDSSNASVINGYSPTYTSGQVIENDVMHNELGMGEKSLNLNGEVTSINPGGTIIDDDEKSLIHDNLTFNFVDYDKVSWGAENKLSGIDYKSISYSLSNFDYENIHTYSYMIYGLKVPSREDYFTKDNYDTETSYIKYADNAYKAVLSGNYALKNIARKFEATAGTYDRSDRETMKSGFGYLWATESTSHYFYQLVKDSFKSNISLGELIGQLQGQYKATADGEEARFNFMYATKENPNSISDDDEYFATGYVRDILDLENMFTNTVPYLYQVQLLAGGSDGDHGALSHLNIETNTYEPDLIENYSIYNGENLSFFFRCNWVVKLMECPEYNTSMNVWDQNGNKYVVKNPLLPEYYPATRPMIFSEAQMMAYGLEESDLNVVELKCLEANKQVAKKWTLLINYAGTNGLTCEVLMRQMALDATMIFNDVFSPTVTSGLRYSLVPQSLDLRNISFDSVMKMLMVNVTKDTSYIYGNTMKSVVESSSIVTQILLLVITFTCAILIPIIRDFLMAMLFYFGIFASLRSIMADNKYKLKVVGGQLISNLIFLAATCGYYIVYYLLLEITNTDDVLTTRSVSANPGNPTWLFIIILWASYKYIQYMVRQMRFTFNHSKDMGFNEYQSYATSAVKRVGNKLKSIKSDLDFRNSDGKSGGGSGSSNEKGNKPKKKNENSKTDTKGAASTNAKEESADTKKKKTEAAEKKQDQQSSGHNFKDKDKDSSKEKDKETAQKIDDKIKNGESDKSAKNLEDAIKSLKNNKK